MKQTRRTFLRNGLLGFAAATLPTQAFAQPKQSLKFIHEPRLVGFRNLHTGETFSGVYKIGNTALPDAMKHIEHIMRDHRTGDTHIIDEKLLDYMFTLRSRIQNENDFVVLSAYRSPKTNAMLRRTTEGVAKDSYHMKGQAVDIRVPGYSADALGAQARALRLGGVGCYTKSQFVHIDTGPIRSWT